MTLCSSVRPDAPTMRAILAAGLLLGIASAGCRPAVPRGEPAQVVDCCANKDAPHANPPAREDLALDRISLPASRLVDQDGRSVDLARDIIAGRVAAIQFVFTRCATTCPILASQFEGVRGRLGDGMGRDFALVSISVDPDFDRPETLKNWGRRHGVGAGWSMLTGPKPEVDRLLGRSGMSSADPRNHQSRVLVLDGTTGQGIWTSGLSSADELTAMIRRVRSARPASPTVEDAAERYFTNASLVDQAGRRHRFYRDLLRDRVVVINVFFSECKGSCVAMGNTLARLQDRLGDRLEREVRLLSITVDSPRDTVDVLSAYARRYRAREGWYFLGGEKAEVDALLKRLGQYVEAREAHGAVLLVGNLRTGLWKKVFGLAGADDVIEKVSSVIDDKGTG